VLALLAAALALATALWFLPERAESARTPPGPSPAEPASPPAPVALESARTPAPPTAAERPPARTGRLVLQLVAPTGTLPDGTVSVTLTRADGRIEPELELTREAPRRELECEPGELTVTARTQGTDALSSQPTHTAVRVGTTAFVELELAPAVRLRGSVRDEEGAPLEGISVALARRGAIEARAKSDAAGGFALAPLPAGEYELVLGDPRGPLIPRAPLVLAKGDDPRELVVPSPVPLRLRIIDSEGAPVPGVRIEGTGKPGGLLEGVTDEEGRLRVEQLPPGDYRIFARHDGRGRGTRAIALDAKASAYEFEIVLYR
jgi:protocatechuate 3,4-dioxygenase beta subunit